MNPLDAQSDKTRTIGYREACLFLAILVVAAALRMYRLDAESLWYDEVVSVLCLDAPTLSSFWQQERELDLIKVPAYFYLEYLYWHHISDTEYGLRLLSVLFGLLTVGTVWWMGRVMFSPGAGLIAAGCAACSQILIYQAQEVRMYVLMYLLAGLSVLALERALTTGKRGWWLAHWVSSGLLVWTHVFGALVLLAQGLALLSILRHRFRVVVFWTVAQGIYLAPLAWYLATISQELSDEQVTWIPLPSFSLVLNMFWTVLPGTELRARAGIPPISFQTALTHIAGALLWCCAGWLLWRTIRGPGKESLPKPLAEARQTRVLLLLLWCVVPILALMALSYAMQPCLVDRYIGHCALPLFVLAGAGIDSLGRVWARRAVVLVLVVLFLLIHTQWSRPLRPDLRSAAAVVERQSVGGEKLFVDNVFESGLAFTYYAQVDAERITKGESYVREAIKQAKNRHPVWLLSVGGSQGISRFRGECEKSGITTTRYSFPGRRTVHLVHAVPGE